MVKKKASRKRRPKKGRAKYKIASFKKKVNKRNYDRRYMKLRAYVIARGRWKCGLCNTFSSKLDVHHIRKWSTHRLLRTKATNLIAVCKKCHNNVIKNREDQFRGLFMRKVRYQTKLYKKEPLSLDEVREQLDVDNVLLPEGFKPFKYKTSEEVKIKKAKEHYLRKFWRAAKSRCSNPNNRSYKTYGARGIKVFKDWEDSYDTFYEWIIASIGERPTKFHSLDRVDNDRGYEPGNLKWSTPEEQGQNRTTTVLEPHVVEVIFILFHKYKYTQSKLMYLMDLNNATIVSNVTNFKTHKNVTLKYKSIISKAKKNTPIWNRIAEYEEKNKLAEKLNENNN